MRDVLPVHLKEASQVRTGIRTAEGIRTQHGERSRHERAGMVRIRTHVVGSRNHRTLAAFQQLGHAGLAFFFFRVRVVPTLGVEALENLITSR